MAGLTLGTANLQFESMGADINDEEPLGPRRIYADRAPDEQWQEPIPKDPHFQSALDSEELLNYATFKRANGTEFTLVLTEAALYEFDCVAEGQADARPQSAPPKSPAKDVNGKDLPNKNWWAKPRAPGAAGGAVSQQRHGATLQDVQELKLSRKNVLQAASSDAGGGGRGSNDGGGSGWFSELFNSGARPPKERRGWQRWRQEGRAVRPARTEPAIAWSRAPSL